MKIIMQNHRAISIFQDFQNFCIHINTGLKGVLYKKRNIDINVCFLRDLIGLN